MPVALHNDATLALAVDLATTISHSALQQLLPRAITSLVPCDRVVLSTWDGQELRVHDGDAHTRVPYGGSFHERGSVHGLHQTPVRPRDRQARIQDSGHVAIIPLTNTTSVQVHRSTPYTDTEMLTLEQLAVLARVNLQRLDIERERRHIDKLEVLTDLGASLAGMTTREHVFRIVADYTEMLLGATRASLAIREDNDVFNTTVLTGAHAGATGPLPRALSPSLREAQRTHEAVYRPFRRHGEDPDSQMLASDAIRSTLVSPLWIDGRFAGTLNLGSPELDPWDERDRDLAARMCALIGEALRSCETLERSHEARQEAVRASVAKGRFLSALSHELRTPMHGVIGMTGLMRSSGLTPQQCEHLDVIQGSAEAMVSMIQDLLDFSNYEQGNLVVAPRAVNTSETITHAVQLFERAAAAKSLELTLNLSETLPSAVEVDPSRLRQALASLISNALKFTDEGTVEITARWQLDTLALEVRDTGPGIPDEIDIDLFAPFSQLDSSDTRRHGGTGIGLALCRMLVRAMSGAVGYSSTLGEGSTFHMRVNAPCAVLEVPEPVPSKPRTLRVLVAEDNRINQLVVRRLLEHLGHQAHTVADGAQAVQAAREATYDLVLMDLQMPVMDGFEATERILAELGAESPPVIALTANDSVATRARAKQTGMRRFLTKPLALEQLAAVLASFVSQVLPS